MIYFVYNFQAFLLVLVRMHTMFLVAPFFSSDVLPYRLRVLLSFFVTLIVFPILMNRGFNITGSTGDYAIMVLREIFIGLFIGFLASIIFTAFQLAGDFFSVQIGFGFSEVVDPMAQISIPVLGQLKNMIGLLVFLALDGHHFLIKAVCRSYELAPLVSLSERTGEKLIGFLAYSFSGMFFVALKIAIPIMATVFLISVSLGVLGKAAPQMNIMMLGFPFKIIAAFGLLAVISPVIIKVMSVSIERMFDTVSKVIMGWPG